MSVKKCLSIAVFILAVGSCFSQEFNNSRMDSLMNILRESNRFMGSISVAADKKVMYSGAVGFADLESEKKATIKTKYRIGSITKIFTSALILKAVEEGRLALDQTIDTYFPDVPNAQRITVENLLNHRSGIYNFTNDPDYLVWNTEPKTEDEILTSISTKESVFDPDSKAEYSNTNYLLLTLVLQKIYDDSYSNILENKILKPIGLKETYVGSKIDVSANEAFSYKFLKNWEKESETDMSIPLGAGSIVSTPTDLTIFVESLFSGKIINESSLEKMTKMRDGYGLGIFRFPYYEKELFGHTGGIDGFSSFLIYLVADKLAVAITSNGSKYDNNDFLIGALSCYYDKPYKLPVFGSIELNAADLEKYLGVYSSVQLPLKITITKSTDSTSLVAQATGQPAFQLDATNTDIFAFNQAGIVLEFEPSQEKMILKQGGGTFTFSKD